MPSKLDKNMSKAVAATSEDATDRRYIKKGKTTKRCAGGRIKKKNISIFGNCTAKEEINGKKKQKEVRQFLF